MHSVLRIVVPTSLLIVGGLFSWAIIVALYATGSLVVGLIGLVAAYAWAVARQLPPVSWRFAQSRRYPQLQSKLHLCFEDFEKVRAVLKGRSQLDSDDMRVQTCRFCALHGKRKMRLPHNNSVVSFASFLQLFVYYTALRLGVLRGSKRVTYLAESQSSVGQPVFYFVGWQFDPSPSNCASCRSIVYGVLNLHYCEVALINLLMRGLDARGISLPNHALCCIFSHLASSGG